MSAELDQMETVLEVACLTEDRAPAEQRAMLAIALRIDTARASFLSGSAGRRRAGPEGPHAPRWVSLVASTYSPSSGQPVALTAPQTEQLRKLWAKFEECPRCGVVAGAHAVQCLTADLSRALHNGADA